MVCWYGRMVMGFTGSSGGSNEGDADMEIQFGLGFIFERFRPDPGAAGTAALQQEEGDGQEAQGMTATEWVGALRYAVWTVGRLQGFPLWRKVQLTFLKVVAVIGYQYGKLSALRRGLGQPQIPGWLQPKESQAPSPRKDRLRNGFTQPRGGGARSKPRIAVVIPIFARDPERLVQILIALEQLGRQKRPADLLVLVDDASPLPLPLNLGNEKVQILRMERNRGPAAARNAGIARAKAGRADIICFTDADCVPDLDWVAVMEAGQLRQPGIVCGRTLSTAPDTAIGLFHDVCGTLNGRMFKDGSMLYGCTCNLSIAVDLVPLAFDESFRSASFEDVDFCVCARKRGIPVTYNKDAIVRHNYDTGIMGLFRQFVRYGLFEPTMTAKHKEYLQWLWSSDEISSRPDLGLAQPASDIPGKQLVIPNQETWGRSNDRHLHS